MEALASASDLPYKVASDPHWVTAGSTRATGPAALPDRRATRTAPAIPFNLTVYQLAEAHHDVLADFAHRYAPDESIPTGRTALARYAGQLAADNPEAAEDYQVRQLVSSLRTALLIGDADDVLGQMECPKCRAWSLVGVRDPEGCWRATCWNQRCAYDPDPSDTDEDADAPAARKPRTWSLHKIAAHYLRTAAA